jgi:hypothetical protein
MQFKYRIELFYISFFFSLLGYIPGFPYWISNIAFILNPIILVFLFLHFKNTKFTLNEILFASFFILSLFLSYLFSHFLPRLPEILKVISPICAYFIARILKIEMHDLIKFLYFVFILSFFFAAYQYFFQARYLIGTDGTWIKSSNQVLYLMKRVVSFIGNANVFGVFTVFSFYILIFETNFNRRIKIIFLIICLLNVILFAKSRTTIAALLFIYFLYLVKQRKFILLGILVSLIVLIAITIYFSFNNEILNGLFRISSLHEQGPNSLSTRLRVNHLMFSMLPDHWLFGIGCGNEIRFMKEINGFHGGAEMATLRILTERGVFGFAILLVALIKNFFINQRHFSAIAIGLSIFIIDITENVIALPQLSTFLAIFMAILANEQLIKEPALKTTSNYAV